MLAETANIEIDEAVGMRFSSRTIIRTVFSRISVDDPSDVNEQ